MSTINFKLNGLKFSIIMMMNNWFKFIKKILNKKLFSFSFFSSFFRYKKSIKSCLHTHTFFFEKTNINYIHLKKM